MDFLHLKAAHLCPPRELVGLALKIPVWPQKLLLKKWHFSKVPAIPVIIMLPFLHSIKTGKGYLRDHDRNTNGPQNSSSPTKTSFLKQKLQGRNKLVRTRVVRWESSLPLPSLQFPTLHFKCVFVNVIPWNRGEGTDCSKGFVFKCTTPTSVSSSRPRFLLQYWDSKM